MADLKISQLTETTAAIAGDYLIINKGDATTQKINISALISGNAQAAPLLHDFMIDVAACNTAGSELHSVSADNKTVQVQYNNWGDALSANGIAIGTSTPIKDVGISVPKTLQMPAGTNAAILFYEGGVAHNTRNNLEGNIGAFRYIKSSHRVQVQNAVFAGSTLTPDSFGVSMGGPVELTTNSTDQYEFQEMKEFYAKYAAITFTEGAQVTFTAKTNINKGGRGSVKAGIGRMVLLPFYDDGNKISTAINAAAAAGGSFLMDEEDDGVIWTEQLEARFEGRGTRATLRHAITSLESRKNNPPAGGASVAEFDAIIAEMWEILDNPSLTTIDVTNVAINEVIGRAADPKYGIGNLFAFESAAGITGRIMF